MVKGNSAAANADPLIYDCMAAFYMACASFMSQNYGAGKPDRVKKSYFISLAYSFGVGLALGGGLFLFGRQFLAFFTTESAVIVTNADDLPALHLTAGGIVSTGTPLFKFE